MNKEELLGFNLAPYYLSFLKILAQEIVNAWTKTEHIKESKLIIVEEFKNMQDGRIKVPAEDRFELFTFNVNNRSSEIQVFIYDLDISILEVNFNDLNGTGKTRWHWKGSIEEFLTSNDMAECCILWLCEKDTTQWAEQNLEEAKN